MSKYFRNPSWSINAGAAAAGVFGIPFPLECLVEGNNDEAAPSNVDWDAELRRLTQD